MNIRDRLTLLDAVSTNISGPQVDWTSQGPGTLQVFGTWDCAVVTIYSSLDNGTTWTAVRGGVFINNSIVKIEAGVSSIKAVVSDVGTSSITAYITPEINTTTL